MDLKSRVDKVFSLFSDEEAFSFLKEYLYKDETLAKAFSDHFLSEEESTVELRTEVRGIFRNAAMPYALRDEQSLDWFSIDCDLSRMISKAKRFIDKGKYSSGAAIASEIILAVGEYHSEDEVFNNERWDAYDFCTDDACRIISSLVTNGHLDSEEVKELCEDITRASSFDSYRSYGLCWPDLEDLLFLLESYSLTIEDFLRMIDEKIMGVERDRGRKERFVIQKIDYLRSKGMPNEADNVVEENFDLPGVITREIDSLVSAGKLDEAISALDRAIEKSSDGYNIVRCHARKLDIYKSKGDEDGQIEELVFLMNASSCDLYQYYLSLKALARDSSAEIVSGIIDNKLSEQYVSGGGDLAKICYEEHLMPQLEACIIKCGSLDEPYECAGLYLGVLEPDARLRVLSELTGRLRSEAVPTKRSRYQYLRQKVSLLLNSCEEGRQAMTSFVEELRRKYYNRPALMSELSKLDI